MMKDLSHWDFDDEFSAKEAALLIRGLDPNDTDIPDSDPVLRRLESAYEGALFELKVHHESSLEAHTSDERKEWLATLNPELLHCTGMTITDEFLYSEWMFRRMGDNLGAQKFSRMELARWLKATGRKTLYQFDTALPPVKPEEVNKTPVPPKMQRQEDRIIELLQTNGFDPLNLPTRNGRGDGAKSIVRKLAEQESDLRFTTSTFDAAWDRLRKEGRLAGGHHEHN